MFARSGIARAVGSVRPSRRSFLKGAGATAGALVIGVPFEAGKFGAAQAAGGPGLPSVPANPSAFIRIAPDNTVTVLVKHLDMGQGVTTGLPAIVAEELDADWAQMRAEHAPANPQLYNNLAWGPYQGTGGSTAVFNSWTQLRKAGAAARAMLVEAAAQRWRVPAGEITVEKGIVRHARSRRQATFGELSAAAAQLPVPAEPKLKDPKDFKLIGTTLPRLDSPAKTTGRATFSLDARVPGKRVAMVAHPPKFGGTVRSFDATAAKAVKGVVDVVQIPTGVAVVAEDTWSAIRGREALRVEWDLDKAETRSSDDILAEFRKLADGPTLVAASKGDAAAGLSKATKTIDAEFSFPYLAHAAMEPMNGTIARTADGVEIWAGSQLQTLEQFVVGRILGVEPAKVKINTLFAGGSFGRRATTTADYLAECATIVKATEGRYPVHLVRTREDDMRAGYFRPLVYHKVRAGLDSQNRIVGWEHRIVGQSILIGSPFEAALVKGGVDATSVEGVADTPYALGDFRCEVVNAKAGVPILWWRSVGHTHTAQAMEVMIDDLAAAAGQDPVAFRLALLKDAPRDAAVLRLATEKAGWGERMPAGRGRGVAVHESFQTHVAMVADVTVSASGVKVDRIVAAVDCGIAITPDQVKAQVEGAIGFALSSVTRNAMTLKDGEVQETNFDAFEPTRISEMPKVEVHIVPSTEAPTGIGEPGVPTLAPAISNAIFAATGRRLRSLPLDLRQLRST